VNRVVLLALLAPAGLAAQDVVVQGAQPGGSAAIIQRVVAAPHVIRAGSGRLELPRDSTITSSLLVFGQPTYLASRVNGDVVVVGADLFLRPGVDVRGQAVAIGGTVAETTLGQVANGTLSLRDETYDVTRNGDRFSLRYRSLATVVSEPAIELPGLQGLLMPSYDRVDGLSLPVGVTLTLAQRAVELQPTLTYRSRLGVVDPGLLLRVTPSPRVRLEAHAARDTRTSDDWIYSDLVNSLTTVFAGTDTRNYFRSDGGDARLIATFDRESYLLEPYLGARLEHVRPITATGDVWSVFGRTDSLGIRRPNPLVEEGDVRSAIAGLDLNAFASAMTGRFAIQVEQSFASPASTSDFLQLTVHGSVEFPTFGTQSLRVKVHGVATHGDNVPRSRYAYLGGSGTLSSLDLLEEGGSALLYVENRYLIPIEAIQLPVIGAPVFSVRDAFGAAGVGSLPALQHEIGAGIGVSMLHLDVNTGVTGRKRTNVSLGISLSM
jgi:hypothetical protein